MQDVITVLSFRQHWLWILQSCCHISVGIILFRQKFVAMFEKDTTQCFITIVLNFIINISNIYTYKYSEQRVFC